MKSVTESLLDRFDRLSPSSCVSLTILQYLSNEDVGAADVALIAATDPVLAAKIMRMANSNLYSMTGRISRLNVAIAMIGLATVQTLAMSSVVEALAPIRPADREHSIKTAAASAMLAPHYHADHGTAFSAGLLHDIGTSLLWEYDPSGYSEIERQISFPLTEQDQDKLLQLEFERYNITHAELSCAIMQEWNLPQEICNAVRSHHGTLHEEVPLLLALSGGDRLATLTHGDLKRQDVLLPYNIEVDKMEMLLKELGDSFNETVHMTGGV